LSQRTIGIVGGGIVGLAVAREIAQRFPGDQVVVLEKEDRLGAHQTGHNSGVVHAGIYYRPGSLKAQLCTRGRSLLEEYCAERDLPYDRCGKLVVAVDAAEMGRFDALERTARANGVPGLTRVDGEGIGEIEPYASGIAALHSPATAITDYGAISRALGADVEAAGGVVHLAATVTAIARRGDRIDVSASGEVHTVDRLVLCAGLQSDRVAALAGTDGGPRIVPFRGEYMSVASAKQDRVRGMIYPVPDPRYPFLGVHFTRRVGGGLEVGPNAFLALSREHYGRASFSARDVRDTVTWPGFWRFAAEHWRTGITEARGVLSTQSYMNAAQRYVPSIGAADVRRSGLGLRAQAVGRDGSLVDDFVIEQREGVTAIRNAPSPAATSSLAIAEHVVARMGLGR
jgi:L-2-hydroxyglutarate oxidase LhgO